MASKYSIEAVFKLIDQVSAPTSKVGRALDKLGIKSKTVSNALKNNFDKASARIDKLGASIKKWAGRAVLGAIAAIGIGVGVATKQFIDFDAAVVEAGALFKDLDPSSTEAFQESLKEIEAEARRVAAITEYSAVDTAGALQKMAMAGMTSAQSIALLEGTTNLATAAGTDLTTAVDIATDALGAFGMSATKENLGRISDVMAKTASSFNTSLTAMFETIKYAGPAFTGAGQSVETLSASIGILANAGIKGSDAGTALNAIFTQLKTAAKQTELKKLGISISDAEGNFLNLFDILAQLENKLAGMGDVERGTILSSIFGVRGEKAVNLLLQTGTAQLKEYEAMLQDSAGAAQKMADVMRGSIKNQLAGLGSALTELGFKFLDAFQGKGVELIKKFTQAVRNFDPTPIINFATTAIEVITAVARELARPIKLLWDLRGVLIPIIGVWLLYQGVIHGITLATGAYTLVQKGLKIATGIATVAQWAFNAALIANPVGVVIAAIVALIAIIVLLVLNWDKVTAAVKRWQDKIVGIFLIIFPHLAFLISLIKEVAKNWDRVVASFKDGGIIGALKTIGGVLVSAFLAPIQGLLEILSYIPGLGYLAEKGANKIQEFRNFLTGVDGATVTQDVNVSKETEEKLTPDTETPPIPNYNFDVSGIDTADGVGGKSKLHGVTDISGGAIPGTDGGGTYTATGAVNSASPPTGEALITRTAVEIAAILRRIDAGVSRISQSLSPIAATRTGPITPRVRMGGDEGASDYSNPRNIAPVTQAERMAYSFSERRETIVIEVTAEKGTAARIVRAPRDVDIRLVTSGGNR
jgi:TP901 family phage tail tape measure protein